MLTITYSAALAGNVTEDVALPLVQELLSAVDTATSVLGGLTPTVPAATSAEKREAGEAVAELLSGLLAVRLIISSVQCRVLN